MSAPYFIKSENEYILNICSQFYTVQELTPWISVVMVTLNVVNQITSSKFAF